MGRNLLRNPRVAVTFVDAATGRTITPAPIITHVTLNQGTRVTTPSTDAEVILEGYFDRWAHERQHDRG